MINPYYGILINGQYYEYEPESYRRAYELKNSSQNSQNSRTFQVQGAAPYVHTLTLPFFNTYNVKIGTSMLGETTWLGVSRLKYFKDIIGATGTSIPITFVAPDGSTHLVVPTGSIQEDVLFPTPKTTGVEFRISLTLENTQ